jgi:hypothetical protein
MKEFSWRMNVVSIPPIRTTKGIHGHGAWSDYATGWPEDPFYVSWLNHGWSPSELVAIGQELFVSSELPNSQTRTLVLYERTNWPL